MNYKTLTYQKSGVNIKAADNFVKFISKKSKTGKTRSNSENIGGFGSISKILEKENNKLHDAMSDDVNTPEALAVIHSLIKQINQKLSKNKTAQQNKQWLQEVWKLIQLWGTLLGLFSQEPKIFINEIFID